MFITRGVFGQCEAANGMVPFDSLVQQVMTRPPYNEARRAFWIFDNCSVHRGQGQWSVFVSNTRSTPRCNSFAPQLTPVGSTKWKSTFDRADKSRFPLG